MPQVVNRELSPQAASVPPLSLPKLGHDLRVGPLPLGEAEAGDEPYPRWVGNEETLQDHLDREGTRALPNRAATEAWDALLHADSERPRLALERGILSWQGELVRRAVPLLLLAITLAACGGGAESDTTGEMPPEAAGEAPTRAEYIAEADAICAEHFERAEALAEPSEDLESQANFYEEGLSINEDLLARLRALEPPAEDRETVEEFLLKIGELNQAVEGFIEALRAGDAAAIDSAAQQIDSLATEVTGIAEAYGFADCAEG